MDLGFGFELKTTKVTGTIVILGSVILTVIFYWVGRNFI
jgi:succinate dehydrogenase / fumarate reductase cytochrome b subunit